MASDHVNIAEAVKDSLNATAEADGFSQRFTAERGYWFTQRLEEHKRRVIVQPIDHDWMDVSRERTGRHEYGVGVVVVGPVSWTDDGPDRAELDAYLFLVQDISDHLRDAGRMSSATLLRMSNEPLWSQDVLQNAKHFLSMPVFTYLLHRNDT